MRGILTVLLVSGMAWGQAADTAKPADAATQTPSVTARPAAAQPAAPQDSNAVVIPAGTKIPLLLKQAISTKNAREGDAVYAETAFPFVVNDRIVIPAGTYIQGKIVHTEKAGRSKKRAEILIHFTTMIYPSGYTVMLPGSVENTPGADSNGVKDKEGTIQADKDTGKRVEDAAKGAAVGGAVGSIGGAAAGGYNGARIGGLAGLAGGVVWALLKHGPEVKLDVGTSLEMEIQRNIPVDASRIQVAKVGS
jgi:type IV secretion system protein VirB10